MKNADKPAYPLLDKCVEYGVDRGLQMIESGLSKREMFAMAAMQGIISGIYSSDVAYNGFAKTAAKYGYGIETFAVQKAGHYADELLKQLES